MSFEVVCSQCGAASGPSVGTCPFCKTVLVSDTHKANPAVNRLKSLFDKGQMEDALLSVREITENIEKYGDDSTLLLLCAKVLFETEAPTGQIKTMLVKASLVEPDNSDITDFMSLLHAKTEMSFGSREHAKQILWSLLQRNPDHVHAHFLAGVFLNSKDQNPVLAIQHLEKCVSLRPNFIRAWGCLAAIARKLGHKNLAERALNKCVGLETNGSMKAYFKRLLGGESGTEKKAA